MNRRFYTWLECILLFGGLPLVILFFKQRLVMVGILWLTALGTYLVLRRFPGFTMKGEWNWPGAKEGMREMLQRFCKMAPLLLIFTWLHDPDRLFSFPLERPKIWVMVMVLYPVLSVLPQELIFRSFFHTRYSAIFTSPRSYAIATAIAFGYAHIIFANWIAIVFTAFGGWMFAQTYTRHRSLALICIEHALYGCLVFTLGLGWYFYGVAWQRQ